MNVDGGSESLVGKPVRVLRDDLGGEWVNGVVSAYDPVARRHEIMCEDHKTLIFALPDPRYVR